MSIASIGIQADANKREKLRELRNEALKKQAAGEELTKEEEDIIKNYDDTFEYLP